MQREAPFWWWCHEEARSWYAQDPTTDPLRGGTGFRYTDRFGTELIRAEQKERLLKDVFGFSGGDEEFSIRDLDVASGDGPRMPRRLSMRRAPQGVDPALLQAAKVMRYASIESEEQAKRRRYTSRGREGTSHFGPGGAPQPRPLEASGPRPSKKARPDPAPQSTVVLTPAPSYADVAAGSGGDVGSSGSARRPGRSRPPGTPSRTPAPDRAPGVVGQRGQRVGASRTGRQFEGDRGRGYDLRSGPRGGRDPPGDQGARSRSTRGGPSTGT